MDWRQKQLFGLTLMHCLLACFRFDGKQEDLLSDGNRYATVVLYLSDVEEGGETSLPLATAIDPERQRLTNTSLCAQKGSGMAVRPKKGDALLFFDMDILGTVGDRSNLHASCPTLKGTKWTATKWLHQKHMGRYDPMRNPRLSACLDVELGCAKRARAGECLTNLALTGPDGRWGD